MSDPSPLLAALERMTFPQGSIRLMEICGTHTMAIAKAGLRQLLPSTVQLISGPGCPVCVTPDGAIDSVLALAMEPGITITTYGDMLRVPGSRRGDTLAARKALGADVRMVYSPMDALDIAEKAPERQVVFLGVGFETTAPGTAACILEAQRRGLKNFTVLSLLKYTQPAIELLLNSPENQIDGFICPGHVAAIIGADAFGFLPRQYHRPAVVAGFEAQDVLSAVYGLAKQLSLGKAELENYYPRLVRPAGNPAAQTMMAEVFTPADSLWRGLGSIPESGMAIRDGYADFDAAARFGFAPKATTPPTGCRCGSVLQGQLAPHQCPLFGTVCTPADPVGPCMVSGEGACAAAYKYRKE